LRNKGGVNTGVNTGVSSGLSSGVSNRNNTVLRAHVHPLDVVQAPLSSDDSDDGYVVVDGGSDGGSANALPRNVSATSSVETARALELAASMRRNADALQSVKFGGGGGGGGVGVANGSNASPLTSILNRGKRGGGGGERVLAPRRAVAATTSSTTTTSSAAFPPIHDSFAVHAYDDSDDFEGKTFEL
jgi:hypothetical protein